MYKFYCNYSYDPAEMVNFDNNFIKVLGISVCQYTVCVDHSHNQMFIYSISMGKIQIRL